GHVGIEHHRRLECAAVAPRRLVPSRLTARLTLHARGNVAVTVRNIEGYAVTGCSYPTAVPAGSSSEHRTKERLMPAATVPERPTRVPTSPRQSAPPNPEVQSAPCASTFTAPGVRESP